MVISTLFPPQIAIDSRPKNSQAECLGLFVEAVPRETSETLVSSVLQALAQLCKGSEGSESTPPWQVRRLQEWRRNGQKWWSFQQAMLEYRRVWKMEKDKKVVMKPQAHGKLKRSSDKQSKISKNDLAP